MLIVLLMCASRAALTPRDGIFGDDAAARCARYLYPLRAGTSRRGCFVRGRPRPEGVPHHAHLGGRLTCAALERAATSRSLRGAAA